MNWQSPIFLLIAGIAFGYSGFKMYGLLRLMRSVQGADSRVDRISDRIKETLINVLGQKAVLRKKYAGIFHTMIFWGFIVITVGTLEQFTSTVIEGASFEFLGTTLYSALLFLQDFFTFLVLLGVVMLAYRRGVIKPKHLRKSKDAVTVLTFTGMLMVSILLMNAFHILGGKAAYGSAMPVSLLVSKIVGVFDFSTEFSQDLSVFFKWIHMLIVLGFAMYIPSSKHLHIVAAGPNTFFKTLDRPKGIESIDFENEKITQYGTGKISHLSWKDTLDLYSCTECGRCQELCPAWNTDKPLSPMQLIIDMREQLFDHRKAIVDGNDAAVPAIINDKVSKDVIWACTSCRACEIACPVFIEHTDKIYDIRKDLVMMKSEFPKEVQTVFKNMETNATPWAFSSATRADWAQGLSIPTLAEAPDSEVLLWVGCAGSYDERNKKVVKSFAKIMLAANVKFAILGTEEQCTGDPARRIGNEFLFQTLAKANVETLNRHKVRKIVTSCPHCFNTLKNEYKDFGGNYEVVHHSQAIAKLITEGRIKPAKQLAESVTFHDSCYLGRWNNEYDSPRAMIKAIPGVEFKEISANHDKAMCCGAGGGRMWMEETIGSRVNLVRTEQALATGAKTIAAACPFCMTMLTDGIKAKDKADQVRVKDVAELVAESL